MSLMEEIGNTVPDDNVKTREPEIFDMQDLETSLDTTVEIDDDVPEPNDRE